MSSMNRNPTNGSELDTVVAILKAQLQYTEIQNDLLRQENQTLRLELEIQKQRIERIRSQLKSCQENVYPGSLRNP